MLLAEQPFYRWSTVHLGAMILSLGQGVVHRAALSFPLKVGCGVLLYCNYGPSQAKSLEKIRFPSIVAGNCLTIAIS